MFLLAQPVVFAQRREASMWVITASVTGLALSQPTSPRLLHTHLTVPPAVLRLHLAAPVDFIRHHRAISLGVSASAPASTEPAASRMSREPSSPLDIITTITFQLHGAMTDQTRDEQGTLRTATIFDEAIYLSEALNLPVNQNEEDVDAELALLARESGIQDPYRYLPPREISRALSTVTLDSDHRSSMSIHSQETRSTSFTSAPSRTSRDQLYNSEWHPIQRPTPRPARASDSIDGHDAAATVTPTFVHPNFSDSSPSIAPSVVSDHSSASSSTPAPRRKRGSIFGVFRKNSRYLTVLLLEYR